MSPLWLFIAFFAYVFALPRQLINSTSDAVTPIVPPPDKPGEACPMIATICPPECADDCVTLNDGVPGCPNTDSKVCKPADCANVTCPVALDCPTNCNAFHMGCYYPNATPCCPRTGSPICKPVGGPGPAIPRNDTTMSLDSVPTGAGNLQGDTAPLPGSDAIPTATTMATPMNGSDGTLNSTTTTLPPGPNYGQDPGTCNAMCLAPIPCPADCKACSWPQRTHCCPNAGQPQCIGQAVARP